MWSITNVWIVNELIGIGLLVIHLVGMVVRVFWHSKTILILLIADNAVLLLRLSCTWVLGSGVGVRSSNLWVFEKLIKANLGWIFVFMLIIDISIAFIQSHIHWYWFRWWRVDELSELIELLVLMITFLWVDGGSLAILQSISIIFLMHIKQIVIIIIVCNKFLQQTAIFFAVIERAGTRMVFLELRLIQSR
jgi:hypothetical protein